MSAPAENLNIRNANRANILLQWELGAEEGQPVWLIQLGSIFTRKIIILR